MLGKTEGKEFHEIKRFITINGLENNIYIKDKMPLEKWIEISKDYDILFDIAQNKGPEKSLIILGYSGWGSGQLEGEMERDHWILSDIDLNITFDIEPNLKWNKAIKDSFIKI